MQRKPYTRYSREFKLEAVRQAALGEKPKAQKARALGSCPRTWCRKVLRSLILPVRLLSVIRLKQVQPVA